MSKTPDQLVAEVDDILRGIWTHLEDPESLSIDILRLAVLNGGIGNYVVAAESEMDAVEADYKHRIERSKLNYVRQGESATVAESKAKVEEKELLDEYLLTKKRYRTLRLKREDVDRVIDAARSRLSLIKADIRNQ